MGARGAIDLDRIAMERQRLVDELHRSVDRELARAYAEYLADGGLDDLRRLSGELVDRATALDAEIAALEVAAREATELLKPRSAAAEQPAEQFEDDAVELPPILPSLADPRPPRQRFDDAASRPVDVRLGVRVIVEQMRLTGATDAEIGSKLQAMGVDDPEAVLAQVANAR